ncbi:MAG: asparagine synthase (glutamine-hydrolyzing) [Bacteroidota bacterium]
MCGIAGFIDGGLSHEKGRSLLSSMLEAIAHRGPDARDLWMDGQVALGHNRLSIIDLSADGTQPMHGFDSVIVFNGEVYNYLELRKELENQGFVFRTSTDTEVVLAAYRHYGQSCVDKFVGMWAFAMWDMTSNTLFCSRDRFGIKPFHYILNGEAFHFASEYKALRHSPHFSSALNISQAFRGLQLGWNAYHDETYYEKVRTLPAACNLIWKDGKVIVSKYWDVDTKEQVSNRSHEGDVAQFREMFLQSIRLHMRSDVEVGGCLSGGLDSSAIASAVGTLFPDTAFKTYTVYYEGEGTVDERPWVSEVLQKYPALDPTYFQPSNEDIAESFEKAIYHADVPLAGSSPISQYFVMRTAAKQGIKVLLDGQGSDEYLGGYLHSFYRLIGGKLGALKWSSALSELRAHAKMQVMSGRKRLDVLLKSALTATRDEQDLYEMEYRKYLPFMGSDDTINFRLASHDGSRLNVFLYHLLTTTSLPTLLQFEDRNSMAFSIESRVPFLDHRLVEFAFRLSDDRKISSGRTKCILRDGMKDILPDAIRNRGDKKGFVTPGEVKWLRGPLKHLLDTDFSKLDFIDRPKARLLKSDFEKGENRYAGLVWRLVVLDYWVGKYA